MNSNTCPRCGGYKSLAAKTCRWCANKREFNMRYLQWRKAVLESDHHTCQACAIPFEDRELQAHHIRNYRRNPELRYSVQNGIALCKEHHTQFHRLYGLYNNTWPQMKEYLEGWEFKRKIESEKRG